MSLSSAVDALATRAGQECKSLRTAVDGKAASSHTHAESDITGLVSDLAGKISTSARGAASGVASLDGSTKIPIAELPTGTSSTTVTIGNDARLSDARTPTAHNHAGADITSGTVPYARLPVGTASSTVAAGDDTRLSVKPYPPVTVTYAATVSINASLGTHFRITATGNCQLLATSNATDGQVIVVEFTASGGARTLSLLTTATSQAFRYGSDITALTATTSGTTDLVQFVYNATAARWWPIAYIKGF